MRALSALLVSRHRRVDRVGVDASGAAFAPRVASRDRLGVARGTSPRRGRRVASLGLVC